MESVRCLFAPPVDKVVSEYRLSLIVVSVSLRLSAPVSETPACGFEFADDHILVLAPGSPSTVVLFDMTGFGIRNVSAFDAFSSLLLVPR